LYALFSRGFQVATTEASQWDPLGLTYDWGDWPAAKKNENETITCCFMPFRHNENVRKQFCKWTQT
jgi:hypothetical protein